MQAIVIIQKADHMHLMAVSHCRGQLAASTARTINQDLGQCSFTKMLVVKTTQPDPYCRTRSTDKQQQQQGLDQPHGAWHAVNAIKSKDSRKR